MPRPLTAAAVGLLAAGFAVFLRRVRPAPGEPSPLRRRLRAGIVVVLAAAVGLQLAYSENSEGALVWLLVLPWVTATLCLPLAERLALQGIYLVFAVAASLVLPAARAGGGRESGMLGPAILINFLSFGLSQLLTRRFRRDFLEQWRDLRGHAEEQSRMRQEIESARDVQLAMLPEEAPAAEGLDIAGVSLPASEVGGDYFGYFRTGSGGFAIAAADVAGHGLASGIVLSGIRSGLTLLAGDLDCPGQVLARMHGMVRATNRRRMLVTLAVLLFDAPRRRAVAASAAHPPILRRRTSDAAVEEVSDAALPLGAGLAGAFPEKILAASPGDVFLVHSDGIYEAVDGAGEPYGMERLSAAFSREGGAGTAREVRDALLRDLWAFRGTAPQQDDITLVVVRVTG